MKQRKVVAVVNTSGDNSENAKRAAERARIDRDLDLLADYSRKLSGIQDRALVSRNSTLRELEDIAYSMGASCPPYNVAMRERVYESSAAFDGVITEQLEAIVREKKALNTKLDELNQSEKRKKGEVRE